MNTREDGDVEHAAENQMRGSGLPPEWGIPPGRPYSEERLNWVRTNVRLRMRAQEERRKGLLARVNPARARIELMRKRYSPADTQHR